MKYHIRLNYFDPKLKVNKTKFSYDIPNTLQVQKITKPYIKGIPFLFEGMKLKSDDVRSIEIFESDNDINTCIAMGNKDINSPLFKYDKTSIFERDDLIRDITRSQFDDISAQTPPEMQKTENLPIQHQSPLTQEVSMSNKVFIVHGHDTAVRVETEMLLTKLGLHPIVLFKKADKGDTIIEKIERESSDVVFSIVLYTACDKGCEMDKEDLKPRARQNVVFEHGMMCAKLGRKRVVALLEDGVEMPGDLSGVIYKKIDPQGHWQLEVAKEMREAGLHVDLNKLIDAY